MDEEALVRLVARGDRAAFDELYRRTSPWLAVRLRRRCADDELVAAHLVEDVVAACTDVLLIDEGRLVFKGVPADLAAAGGDGPGDSPADRGYSEIMRRHREGAR